MDEIRPMFGIEEVQRILGYRDHKAVYRHAKGLGGIKIGGMWRFPRHRIEALARGEQPTVQP